MSSESSLLPLMLMEKLTVQSTDSADEEDQISGLPAEVLHHIIRRLEHPGKAGQTIALSRQWRKVWHSYPVVEFYPYQFESNKHFQQFSDSTIERYSRDKLLGMESLKLKPCGYEKGVFVRSPSPVVLPLLDLALERKAEDVQIICAYSIDLPYRVLFNSTVKSLRLAVVAFPIDKYFLDTPLSPTSLRFLCLSVVEFEDRELLTCLIENSPLLETLKLFRYVGNMTKLRVSKASNLKELEIEDCVSVEEIGIVAPQLQSLSLRNIGFVLDFKIELATPLLNFLEISWDRMTERDIEAMISKLPSLKYLTVNKYSQLKMKLKISGSSLVEFKLYNPCELEEIELDAGPGLEKFFIKCRNSLIHELKKCEISNAGASFRSEIWYTFDPDLNGWLVGFKRLMRSSNFHTIFINQRHRSGWQSDRELQDEEVDRTIYRGTIEHLKIHTVFWYVHEAIFLLNCLLGECRPKIVTVSSANEWCKFNWEQYFRLKKCHGPSNWRRQLKLEDVKIEQGTNQVCFSLPWYEL